MNCDSSPPHLTPTLSEGQHVAFRTGTRDACTNSKLSLLSVLFFQLSEILQIISRLPSPSPYQMTINIRPGCVQLGVWKPPEGKESEQ